MGHLILARGIDEQVIITAGGHQIRLTVIGVKQDGRVRLDFVADADVRIDRLEVHEARIRGETKGAVR